MSWFSEEFWTIAFLLYCLALLLLISGSAQAWWHDIQRRRYEREVRKRGTLHSKKDHN